MRLHIFFLILTISLCSISCTKGKNPNNTKSFTIVSIGSVVKAKGKSQIHLKNKYIKGLKGLSGYSHLFVFYWFDKNDTPKKRSILQVHPRGNKKNPLTGVFATRSPVRPNLMALSLCKIISIKGNIITIEKIDAFHNTPVLDIKPYIPFLDKPKEQIQLPSWVKKIHLKK